MPIIKNGLQVWFTLWSVYQNKPMYINKQKSVAVAGLDKHKKRFWQNYKNAMGDYLAKGFLPSTNWRRSMDEIQTCWFTIMASTACMSFQTVFATMAANQYATTRGCIKMRDFTEFFF